VAAGGNPHQGFRFRLGHYLIIYIFIYGASAISRDGLALGGDWTVFFTRPLSSSMLGIAALVIFLPLLGRLRRVRPLQRSEGVG
jgi:TctA family transporter